MKDYPYTHKELVVKMAVWVRQYWGCCAVLIEQKCLYTREQPDILAFRNNGYSYSIEVKTSRSDFFKDGKKVSNQDWYADKKVGDSRYYAVPEYLVHRTEIPQGYGLIYIDKKLRARVVGTTRLYKPPKQADFTRKMVELQLLLSHLSFNQNPDKGFSSPDNPFRTTFRQYDNMKAMLKAIKNRQYEIPNLYSSDQMDAVPYMLAEKLQGGDDE